MTAGKQKAMTVKEAASRYGFSESYLYKLVSENKLASTGKNPIRIYPYAIKELQKNRR